jgi:hypothetical protein
MNNILISHTQDVVKVVLQSRTTSKVTGYMVASLDHDNVYSVVRVVADKGNGLLTYKVAMMYLNTQGITLTSSGDETNKGSISVWKRLIVCSNIVATPLNSLPSLGGIPLFMNDDVCSIDDDSFLNNSYTVTPSEQFFNSLVHCNNIDNLVKEGEDYFYKRYYLKS